MFRPARAGRAATGPPDMTQTAEPQEFQAEVREILDLVVHSLYSHPEVFLRELISNASDALDKRRLEALRRPELTYDPDQAAIRLEVDRERRLLTVHDNGIGMDRDELVANLGTIARSGTRRFLEELRASAGTGAASLIGQFGVGFYASFMVAESVVVLTRRAGSEEGWRWESDGRSFRIEPAEGLEVGTRVELHLETPDADAGKPDFTDPVLLRSLVKRYSDFVEYPIQMAAELFEGEQAQEAPDGARVVVLNSQRPLWARPKDEITPEEHTEFFRHLAHAWGEPLEVIHFRAEGTSEYTALLYLPRERPLDLFDPEHRNARLALYVKRVFVMADCEDLAPPWLRFVQGVVDSEDLPLNVSREILQENRLVGQIRSRIVRKVLEALQRLLDERREDYVQFWRAFGAVLKEGIVVDDENRETVAALSLFDTTHPGGPWTLEEIAGRAREEEALYWVAGDDPERLAVSPHTEALRARGHEVLLLTDPVDEWVVERLGRAGKLELRSAARADVELGGEEDREAREALEREHRGLLGSMESFLGDEVKAVRFSSRLTESPAVLVIDPSGPSPRLHRMLAASGREVPPPVRVLELNARHPVVERMMALAEEDPASERLRDYSQLLLGQALLREGEPLPDPAEFTRLVTELMVARENP